MKVGLVSPGLFPWDRGIGQHASNLVALGHSVFVVAKAPHPASGGRTIPGVPVYHLPYDISTRLGRIRALHVPYSPFWIRWLLHHCRREKPDLLLVQDSHLSSVVQTVARMVGARTMVDLRENLAEMYKADLDTNRTGFMALMRNDRLVRAYESVFLPRFDWVSAVSPELRAWAVGQYDLDPDRTVVLANTVDAEYQARGDAAHAELRTDEAMASRSGIELVFAGFVSRDRGVGEVVEALPIVHKSAPDVRLRIIGEGADIPRLKGIVERLELQESVEFSPLLPIEELPAALARADIGLCSYYITEQTQQTMAGKLFEYMAVGLPVLSSPRIPLMRVIESVKCGRIYDGQTAEVIAAAILEMIADRDELRAMGERAYEAMQAEYSVTRNREILTEILSDVARLRGAGAHAEAAA